MRIFKVVVGTATASVLLLSACSSTKAEGGSPAPNAVKVAVKADLSTGDPALTGSPADENLLINIYDPLTRRTANGKLEAALAISWKAVEPTAWEFALRENVKFQNGEPFNSESVKYSIERITKNPQSPIQELGDIKSIETPNPMTVRIITNKPDPLMPSRLALFGGLMVPSKYAAENGGKALVNAPVGTGPYSVKEWQRGSQITLEANPNYWGGAPSVKTIVVRFIPDDSTRIAALLNGEVRLINAVPPTSAETIKKNSKLRLDTAPGTRIYYASLANRDGPLANVKVRQALSYATDYKAIIDKLMAGYAERISGPLPDSSYGAQLAPDPYPFDLEKARALLNEAGYPKGFTVDFETQQGIDQQLALSLADMWKKVGVNARVTVPPQDLFDDKYEKGALSPIWNSGYTVWQGDPTVLINTFFHTGKPRDHFGTKAFDPVIDGLNSETNEATREADMKEALSVLHDQAPWIYVLQANDLYGAAKDLDWKVPFNQLLRFNELTN